MKKVYVSSSLRKEVYDHVTKVLETAVKEHVFLFRPQKGQLDQKLMFAEVDALAIRECDEVWLIGQYGRDCSWELGYANALGKKIRVYRDKSNEAALEADWMMYAGNLVEVIDLTADEDARW